MSKSIGPNIDLLWIGGECPVQAEGTVEGRPFYFRSRGSSWSFRVGKDPVMEPEWEITAPYGREYEAGYMPIDQARSVVVAAALLYIAARMPALAETPT